VPAARISRMPAVGETDHIRIVYLFNIRQNSDPFDESKTNFGKENSI
jgi:hypothetical protein